MSQQLYFSVLRTACPHPISRIEIKGGILEFIYEKNEKGFKKQITLDKDPKVNLKTLIDLAESL